MATHTVMGSYRFYKATALPTGKTLRTTSTLANNTASDSRVPVSAKHTTRPHLAKTASS